MSPHLALHFLGPPQLQLDDTPVTASRRTVVALLAYLSVNDLSHPGQKYTRESLSGLLWPEYEQSKAYSNLRHTLWELQQAIGEGWLLADRETIGLNAQADIWLDVRRFGSVLVDGRAQTDRSLRIPLLVEAAKLYRNHFLMGFGLRDAPGFSDWAYAESEDLRHQLAEALNLLVRDYCALGQAQSAVPHARRLLALDPADESAHRGLMEVYLLAGNHTAALQQYQACEKILRREFGLDPKPETRALYKTIRKGEIKSVREEKPEEVVAPKHNVPLQLTSFIGREKECQEVGDLVARYRLVTLIGVGGMGKTRLSLQVGERILRDYPDGVWFIPLDSLFDPALVPQTVASVFGISESSELPSVEILKEVLRAKRALLVLDNCEHVRQACAELITTLLKHCPNLRVLATSRETLSVLGEATYYLPSLSIPEHDGAPVAKLAESESVQLFTQRAVLAQSAFALTSGNAAGVVQICRRVDGIPLAIELAAARVNILQVEEIWKQLNDALSFLVDDHRGILPRHQTLRASMDWSWTMLTESEQTLLRQLSVFAGGWTLASAEAVCAGQSLDLTSALVKKALMVVKQEAGRETRYRFHEFIRQYAREKLVSAGEEEKTCRRHLGYFLKLSEEAEAGLMGPEQAEWDAHMQDERDNIRAALEWAAQTSDVEAGLYLASRLKRFWEGLDRREGARWLAEFIQRPESKALQLGRAKALCVQGHLIVDMHQFDQARSAAEECLALSRASGDRRGEIDGLLLSARCIYYSGGKITQAIVLLQQALAMSQSLGDIRRQAFALRSLGPIERDFSRAVSYFEQAVVLYRQLKDWSGLATCLHQLGERALRNGDLHVAETYTTESISLFRQLRSKGGLAYALQTHGRIAFEHGDRDQARLCLQESIELSRALGHRVIDLWSRAEVGYLTLEQGDIAEARAIFSETVRDFQDDHHTDGVSYTLQGMARLYVVVGKPERAARLIGWADAARGQIGEDRALLEQAAVDRDMAACLAKMGEAAFSDAYGEGKAMMLEQAIELALAE